MLKTLRIRNLAIIEDLTVEFGPGLNLLTGETGAGKSILVDALGLAAGDRADSKLVRAGADRAVIEAVFEPLSGRTVRKRLQERGVDMEGQALVVRREVPVSGGGRVFLNGSPSTVAVLREAGEYLVELHGQHDHQSLLSPDRHLELLDEFGGHQESLQRVVAAHREVESERKKLEALQERARSGAERTELLRRRMKEIESVAPRPGELASLVRERKILQNSGLVVTLLQEAVGLLYEGEATAASLAAGAASRVSKLAELDPEVREIAGRVDAARLELEDAGVALRDYRDRTQFDPLRLEELESRRAALENLLLQYGPDEEAALRTRGEAIRELEDLEDLETEEQRIRDGLTTAESRYLERAAALTRSRRRAAERMAPRMEEQFAVLALERARFRAVLSPSRGSEAAAGREIPLHPRGAERAEFLLTANPGEEARPLSKVASGGELSRVMLALHVLLEKAGDGQVLVFDEVDAGVGGAVADAVGARLRDLAKRHQVLCLTHLPQVAAYAHRHYHVKKHVVGERTRAEVTPLDGEQQVNELARMLGGKRVTAASRRNATELLNAAGLSTQRRRG